MSTRQYLIDASTRHQIFLQRYAGSESKQAQQTLARIRREVVGRLSGEPTAFQQQRLIAVLNDIDNIVSAGFQSISLQLSKSAIDLARDEAEFSVGLYNRGSNVDFVLPADSALIAAVNDTPMAAPRGGSLTIAAALSQIGEKKGAQIKQIIMDGVALGDTSQQIAARVSEVANTLYKRQVDALTRTIVNHSSSVARTETYKANSDLLDGYQWVSTLDSRTTVICGSRDGMKYSFDTGPMPPAHWNCRSTTVPLVKDEYDLGRKVKGERAAVGADGKKPVSSGTTYAGWLKRQPVEFVDEALGPERSKLFRSGKLKLNQFVDPTGRLYTLDQLRGMDSITLQEF